MAENRGNRLWQRGRRRLQTPGGGVFLRPSAVKTLRAPPSRQGPLLLSSMTSQRGRQPGRPASACCHLALPPPGRVPGCRGTPKRASGSVRSAQIRALQQSAGGAGSEAGSGGRIGCLGLQGGQLQGRRVPGSGSYTVSLSCRRPSVPRPLPAP